MNLIKVNLLPYRELQEQKQKKQFQTLLALGALAGLGLAAFVYMSLAAAQSAQESRNDSLQAGIKQLDAELQKIKELQATKQNYLARKQKVEELDNKRFEGARMIDTLDQLVPEGVYLISISNTPTLRSGNANTTPATRANVAVNNEYYITGNAISDNKVATFMTALPSTGVFETPQLNSIRKTDGGQQFVLQSKLVEQKIVEVEIPVAASAAVPESKVKPKAKTTE